MGEQLNECRYCKITATGKFCNTCGQKLAVQRISLGSILHEAFHFFTHLDHGFPYTLKRLLLAPGTMQKEYLEGLRQKYQKPFSMYFLCATFAALVIYWVNVILIKHFNAGEDDEALFFHKYWVFLQLALQPLYSLITYFVFKRAKYNFGEIVVFLLYQFSFVFVILSFIHLLKFVAPHLQTRYIELPVILIYAIITHLHFFLLKKWVVVCLTVFSIGVCFLLSSLVQDFLVGMKM